MNKAYAQLDSTINLTTSILELADQVLAGALESIKYRFSSDAQSFFNSSGQPVVLKYDIPQTSTVGLDKLSPIKNIKYGFIDNSTLIACNAMMESPNTDDYFDGCLVQNYPGYLGVEVEFKVMYSSGEILPSSVGGLKVLFLAYNTTLYPIMIEQVDSDLQQAFTHDGRYSANNSDISVFTCYNPDGILGEIRGIPITSIRTSSSSLGSLNSCLSRDQVDENG